MALGRFDKKEIIDIVSCSWSPYWAGGGGGSTNPGGSNTQIQYNNSNAFDGVPTLTYDGTLLRGTGSFSGSFTGNLNGSSSYATTASYALNGTVGGSNTQIQFNSASTFQGSPQFTYNYQNGGFAHGTSISPGAYSHAEGSNNIASGAYSHAEGEFTRTEGHAAHAEGFYTSAGIIGAYYAEGTGLFNTIVLSGSYGDITSQFGNSYPVIIYDAGYSLQSYYAEVASATYYGGNTIIQLTNLTNVTLTMYAYVYNPNYPYGDQVIPGDYSHTEGVTTYAINGHAEGNTTYAVNGHAEGISTYAVGAGSHAEGYNTIALADYSHTEGGSTRTTNTNFGQGYAHAEGLGTIASGKAAHSEGGYTTASGDFSHAEGYQTQATEDYAHAEGVSTIASGLYSHTEGIYTIASNFAAHAEGIGSKATGPGAHAEGYYTTASADYSHAEGYRTYVEYGADYAHTSGEGTRAVAQSQFVVGTYNDSTLSLGKGAFVVGDGLGPGNEHNLIYAHSGSVEIFGSLTISGSNTFTNIGPAIFSGSVNISGSTIQSGNNTLIGITSLTGSVNISGSTSIIGTTNFSNSSTTITGSLLISGSTTQIGNNSLTGNTSLTGSIAISGSSTIQGTTTMTGSLTITGSTTQIGNNTLLGNTVLSGSITISGSQGPGSLTASVQIYGDIRQSGYHRFDPVTTNIDTTISASYIYVSGSTNDLYFSQNSKGYANTTRLRWLEGNLYTGLLHGGVITATVGTNTYKIASGSGVIVNINSSYNDNPYPTVQYLTWGNLTGTIDALSGSYDQQFVAVSSSAGTAVIKAQGTPYNDGDYNTSIPIGIVIHQNRSTINAAQTFPGVAYGWKQRSFDFIKAFGPLKISGYTLAQSGSSTRGLVLSGGTAFVDGRNYIVDPNNPSYIVESVGIITSKIYRYYQSGSNYASNWGYDTNAGAGYTDIDPTQYSNAGTLTAVGSNKWTIQRVFYFPNSATKAFYIYYGNAQYANQSEALAAVTTETFTEAPNTAANAIYVGYMLLRNDATFTVPASFAIAAAGLFRSSGAGGGGTGGGGTTTLATLTDVSITSPTYGDLLMYGNTAWNNTKTLSGSYILSGSLNVNNGGSITGSLQGTSSWAINALTASFIPIGTYQITSSWSNNALTASLAPDYVLNSATSSFVTNSQTSSFVQNSQTSSFATLLINNFNGNQTITGSLITSGSVTNHINNVVITGSLIVSSSGTNISNIIGGSTSGSRIAFKATNITGAPTSVSNMFSFFSNNTTELLRIGDSLNGQVDTAIWGAGNNGSGNYAIRFGTTYCYINGSSDTRVMVNGATNIQCVASQINLLQNVSVTDARNFTVGSTTGTKIGTATTEKLGFFNSAPIVQPASTVEVGTALSNLGLRAAGVASFSGSFTGSISMPTRSAFRVTGSNSTDITAVTTITSTNGIGIDYNQGSNYNNTTGIYTAPLAGLYHVYMNIRVGSVNSQMQAIMYKNDTTAQLMWEAPGTAASTHFGVSGIISLAANDNLRVKVTVGKIQFDANDSWGAAYIG